MGKLVIEVWYSDDMQMSVDQMKKNVEHVLESHFDSTPAYKQIRHPRVIAVAVAEQGE